MRTNSNRFNKRKLIQLGIALGILAVALIIILLLAMLVEKNTVPLSGDTPDGIVTRQPEDKKVTDDRVNIDGKWYRYKREIRTTLLIGIDEFGELREKDIYENPHQADFLLLLAKNDDNGDVFSIQINRDTMTNVNTLSVSGDRVGRNLEQICLAFSYGDGAETSCKNTVDAVNELLFGLPVEKYIAMTMSGIGVLNDEVDGVTLPCFCDFPELGYKKDEIVTLTGDEALTYVRARAIMADPTNVSRMERQRQYILAWSDIAKDKFKTAKAATGLIQHISPYLCTNCDSVTMANMAQELGEYKGAPIYVPEGELYYTGTRTGFVEFWPDDAKLKQLILELFYEPLEDPENPEISDNDTDGQ